MSEKTQVEALLAIIDSWYDSGATPKALAEHLYDSGYRKTEA